MREKLICVLLSVLMLCALTAPALASEESENDETVMEDVIVEEPAEAPAEEAPAVVILEESEEPPAQDGLKVFGNYKVSQFAENTFLELTDYTTLEVDCDKTLAGIQGGRRARAGLPFHHRGAGLVHEYQLHRGGSRLHRRRVRGLPLPGAVGDRHAPFRDGRKI